MPFETIWKHRGVYQRFYGVLSSKDREMAAAAVHGNMRFDDLHYWIVDSLEIVELEDSPRDLLLSAGTDLGGAKSNPRIRMAFVANNQAHIARIKRYMKLMERASWKVELFDNLEEAQEWVELL